MWIRDRLRPYPAYTRAPAPRKTRNCTQVVQPVPYIRYRQKPTPRIGLTGYSGTRKERFSSGLRRRSAITAMLTTAMMASVPMVVRFTTTSRDENAAGTAKTTATIQVLATGVRVFGDTRSKTRGISPSRDMDIRIRVCPYITARTTDAMATTAPKAMIPPPTLDSVTLSTTSESAAGLSPTASAPSAPMAPRATAQ